MRKALLTLLLFLSYVKVTGQTVSENDSLYTVAFEKYVIQVDSFYIKYGQAPANYTNIYLEQTDLLKQIPKKIKGHTIIVLTSKNQKAIYQQNNNRLIHLKIFPIEIENDFIKIEFVPYHGTLDEVNEVFLELSAWTIVYFKLDCARGKWKFFKTENGGI